MNYGSIIEPSKYRFVLSALGQELLFPKLFTDYSGQLGTPVADIITIADNLETPTYLLKCDCAIIDVSVANIIKETQVQGRNGRVIEYISSDNYDVTIRGGVFSGEKDTYPENEIRILDGLRFMAQVEVTSAYLDLLGIRSLVIKKLHLPQRAGRMSAQAFELSCISETPYELEVSNA